MNMNMNQNSNNLYKNLLLDFYINNINNINKLF
jgi:hypothetical protein